MSQSKFILLACWFSLFGFSAQAQVLDYRLGEFIIKTQHATDRVEQTHAQWQGRHTSLQMQRVLSSEMGIYLFSFDHQHVSGEDFLRHLQQSPFVEVAQHNHIIQNRATPNDTEFDDQWQYINTGQSGGTAGADIDMDLAWDITTGGVTVLGDTIVAAIIDDGLDMNHSDFGENLWVNHAEIPNDNIDNDNNGYVDDYLGWNAYQGNGNITGGGHGTPVAGIVGARGNNNLGVAGVNWKVKLMIIQGGGDEADALAAYSYCYSQRKRYNETNGAEGAYVVTTNASWGVDFGQASEAPLWCAFYDSLGVQGIVSCGATTNQNQDVDAVGDLPTSCGSDYLISVTNMNHLDEKVFPAGYGSTSVDLGAFGEGTWTTAFGNGYGGFGGTSGATPHVAGVVALMHAVPCPSFAAFAKQDPAAAALLVKQYILDGVDPNPSLAGLTVTAGRLNAYNAVNAIVMNCDTNSCLLPYSVMATNITDSSAQVEWTSNAATTSVNLRYRETGTDVWIEASNVTSPHTLSGLSVCMAYEYQMQSICEADTSNWTAIFPLLTDGCCEAPNSATTTNVADTEATISWPSVLAAISYNIRYRQTGASSWMEINAIISNSTTLTNLMPCSNYEFQTGTYCTSNELSPYSNSYTFSTTGCGACIDQAYCPASAEDASAEYIEQFSLGDINNVSSWDDGYGDYTGVSTDLMQGDDYTVSIVPGFPFTPYSEHYRVWIDYNQNGTFDLPSELAYDSESAITTPATGIITIPIDAALGATRLRVSMRWQTPAEPCDNSYDYGEVEDYCVNITAATTPDCNGITSIAVTDTTASTITIDWMDVADGTSYEFQYREVGGMVWQDTTTNTSDISLTHLTACRDYEYRARVICANGLSAYSSTNTFSTPCPPCDVVTEITLVDSTETTATLSWSSSPNAVGYLLQYRLAGTAAWQDMGTSSSGGTIVSLTDCGNYECRVRMNCGSNTSDWSAIFSFSTVCTTNVQDASSLSFALYPNPTSSYLQVEMPQAMPWEYRLIGMDGKILAKGSASASKERIEVGHLPAGLYWVEITQDNRKGYQRCVKL